MKVYVKDRDMFGIDEVEVKTDSLVEYLQDLYKDVIDDVRIAVIDKQTCVVYVYACSVAKIAYSTNYKSVLRAM